METKKIGKVPNPPAMVTSAAIAGPAVPAMGALRMMGNWALGLRSCSFENDIFADVELNILEVMVLNITAKSGR